MGRNPQYRKPDEFVPMFFVILFWAMVVLAFMRWYALPIVVDFMNKVPPK